MGYASVSVTLREPGALARTLVAHPQGCGIHGICRSPGMDRTDRCDFIGAW
jgi:hypothetical protein